MALQQMYALGKIAGKKEAGEIGDIVPDTMHADLAVMHDRIRQVLEMRS